MVSIMISFDSNLNLTEKEDVNVLFQGIAQAQNS